MGHGSYTGWFSCPRIRGKLTGSVTLRIVAFINGSLRSSTYTTALEP